MPTSSALEHLTIVLPRLAGPEAVLRDDQLAAVDAVLKPPLVFSWSRPPVGVRA